MTPSNDTSNSAMSSALRWLVTHTHFPAQRLEPRVELLVLLHSAATALNDEQEEINRLSRPSGGGPSTKAHLRSYKIRRRHAHVKCDNSAKV